MIKAFEPPVALTELREEMINRQKEIMKPIDEFESSMRDEYYVRVTGIKPGSKLVASYELNGMLMRYWNNIVGAEWEPGSIVELMQWYNRGERVYASLKADVSIAAEIPADTVMRMVRLP